MRAAVTFEAPGLEPKKFDGGTDAPELLELLVLGLRAHGLAPELSGTTLTVRVDAQVIDVFAAYRGADFLVGMSRPGDDAPARQVRDAIDATIRALPDVRTINWYEEKS
jgi:hypothetical protein